MRWIVDAMNVIGSRPDGWWRDRERASARLVDRLERFVAATGDDVTVVFERKPGLSSSLVRIAYARKRGPDAADFEIARIVAADPAPTTLTVVTSDRWLGDQVGARGATVFSSASFRARIDCMPPLAG